MADAIDSIGSKIELILAALRAGVPIVSSMGAGNKLDPTRFRIADISRTHTCPMARAVRTALRKRGVTGGLTVVFSDEPPASQASRPRFVRPGAPGRGACYGVGDTSGSSGRSSMSCHSARWTVPVDGSTTFSSSQ